PLTIGLQLLPATAALVVHGDVHEHLAAVGIEAHDQGLGILVGLYALALVHLRWMHLEVKTLITQGGNSVADDLVGEFADGLAHQFVGLLALGAGHDAGHAGGGGGLHVKNDAAFDVADHGDHGGVSLAVVGAFFHYEMSQASLAVEVLG